MSSCHFMPRRGAAGQKAAAVDSASVRLNQKYVEGTATHGLPDAQGSEDAQPLQ